MNDGVDPSALVACLEKVGMVIDQCEIRPPVTADDREFASIIGRKPPPKAIDALYDQFDGFTLIWHGDVDGKAVRGSINILPYTRSVSRAALKEEGAPLEGILWTSDTPEGAARQLREMAIFETITGRSQFVTYRVDQEDACLFFVDRDDIYPIVPDFKTSVGLLFRYAGADGLLEFLIHDDWKNRLEKNAMMKRVANIISIVDGSDHRAPT